MGPAKVPKCRCRLGVWNAAAVVRNLDELQASERVVFKVYANLCCIGVQPIPNEFGPSQHGLSDLRYSLEVVVMDVDGDFHSECISTAKGERRQAQTGNDQTRNVPHDSDNGASELMVE